MENPFKQLDNSENPPGDTRPEKQKKIDELREWKKQVEVGMGMEPVREDRAQLDRIDEEIRKLEQDNV